jgi:hypothetical protein
MAIGSNEAAAMPADVDTVVAKVKQSAEGRAAFARHVAFLKAIIAGA